MVRCRGEKVEGGRQAAEFGESEEYYMGGERQSVREQQERPGECRDSHKHSMFK